MKILDVLVPLLVTLFFLKQYMSFEVVSTCLSIISVIDKIVSAVRFVSKSLQVTKEGDTTFDFSNDGQRKVMDSLRQVSIQIDQTEAQLSRYIAFETDPVKNCQYQDVLNQFNEIMVTMNHISVRYQLMKSYEARRENLEKSTLIRFAEDTIGPSVNSVSHLTAFLYSMMFGNANPNFSLPENILKRLALYYNETNKMCHSNQSVQQFVYTLYTNIALTEIKAYTMIEFSLMLLRAHGQGNFSEEADMMRWDHQSRTEHAVIALRNLMRKSDRTIWRCDPVKHIPEVTYDEVTRLLQGYIENELDLNTYNTCRYNCAYYQSAKSEGCYQNLYCAKQQKCSGDVLNCQFVESAMSVCQASRRSNRRYEYIEYENGRVLGQRKNCERTRNDVESWSRFILWQCSYCFCLCDEQGLKSDRYFNLRKSVADDKNNKVVTGLRFVKKNRIFHLQIQQGQMLPLGAINESTIEWKPVDNYSINDWGIVEGKDYHKLTYTSRAIDLDDVMSPRLNYNLVLTGLRFQVFRKHMSLLARFCAFDFKSGKLLNQDYCMWEHKVSSSYFDEGIKLNLDDLDVPTRSSARSIPLSNDDKHFEFVNSGINEDAAQTTLPFIDIQDVVSNPPVPLAGVGIYYKSSPGYGGFVAPKIMTYDFTPYVQLPMTN